MSQFERLVNQLQHAADPSIEEQKQLKPLRKRMKAMLVVAKQLLRVVAEVRHRFHFALFSAYWQLVN